jgi:DNA-binding transcriptional regulator of glucitol operon
MTQADEPVPTSPVPTSPVPAAQVPAGKKAAPALRYLLTPRWLAVHATVVVGSVVMILLGYWQARGGIQGHSLQTTGYALQWWVFCAFGIGFWIRIMRDTRRRMSEQMVVDSPAADPQSAPAISVRIPPTPERSQSTRDGAGSSAKAAHYAPYRPPPPPAAITDDSALGRYNAYLAQLSDSSSSGGASSPDARAIEH